MGGCAGDDLRMVATHQFYGGAVLTNAVVAAAILVSKSRKSELMVETTRPSVPAG